jgi:glycosyltransferase involved in cell wall biosynthesis
LKVTVLSHNLSTNAVMRAHRLALAARTFADVELVGPVERRGPWPALPPTPWMRTVREKRFPEFANSFIELVESVDGDYLLAVKPQLASFGAALVAAERRQVPLVLDIDDLDIALAPRSQWSSDPEKANPERPASAVYVSLLTRAAAAAAAITVASTALQRRFGGTLMPHGADTELFDPGGLDRLAARRALGFSGPTVVFPGTPRSHKGVRVLAEAVARIPGARLGVLCRPTDLASPEWRALPIDRIPMMPSTSLPSLLAAADVVAIPQLDDEAGRHQMPMKVFDAMAMARPVVASLVSDLPDVLDGCARLVQPGDVDALTGALAELLDDPREAEELGQRARARCVERYSIPRLGEILHRVLSATAGD